MQKKQKINRNNAPKKRQNMDPGLLMRPAFKGQTCVALKVEASPIVFTTTVTTGVISAKIDVQSSAIANFATKFGSLFEEYRIVKAVFATKLFNSTSPGLITSWVDEKNASSPTLAEAIAKSSNQNSFNASSINRTRTLTWTPHDPLDLQYIAIGANTVVSTFKAYTDNINFGSSAVALPYFAVYTTYTIQFRGYK